MQQRDLHTYLWRWLFWSQFLLHWDVSLPSAGKQRLVSYAGNSQPAATLNQDVKRPHLKLYVIFQGQKRWNGSAEWLCLRPPKMLVLVTVCHYATILGRNDSKEEGSFQLVVFRIWNRTRQSRVAVRSRQDSLHGSREDIKQTGQNQKQYSYQKPASNDIL